LLLVAIMSPPVTEKQNDNGGGKRRLRIEDSGSASAYARSPEALPFGAKSG